jgi:3-oxo-5-alpha-steroid 4-dehydrogenase 3
MTQDQVTLMWALMAAQGSRRLYETAMWQKPTQSRMPVSHYFLGIFYYIAMSMAIWVEGIRTQS